MPLVARHCSIQIFSKRMDGGLYRRGQQTCNDAITDDRRADIELESRCLKSRGCSESSACSSTGTACRISTRSLVNTRSLSRSRLARFEVNSRLGHCGWCLNGPELHTQELLENWERARFRQRLERIAPLE